MSGLNIHPHDPSSPSSSSDQSNEAFFITGGLFLEPPDLSSSFFHSISSKCLYSDSKPLHFTGYWRNQTRLRSDKNLLFMSLSLSKEERAVSNGVRRRSGTMNTRKHLWAGAVAAMVSKYITFRLLHIQVKTLVSLMCCCCCC